MDLQGQGIRVLVDRTGQLLWHTPSFGEYQGFSPSFSSALCLSISCISKFCLGGAFPSKMEAASRPASGEAEPFEPQQRQHRRRRSHGKKGITTLNAFCKQYRSGFGLVYPDGDELSWGAIKSNVADVLLHIPLVAGVLAAVVCALAFQYVASSPYWGMLLLRKHEDHGGVWAHKWCKSCFGCKCSAHPVLLEAARMCERT